MHTIARQEDGSYAVVFSHPVAVGTIVHAEERVVTYVSNIDEATHLCNRLNGGNSSEMAALLTPLIPFFEAAVKDLRHGR
jgi:hypothetical protein